MGGGVQLPGNASVLLDGEDTGAVKLSAIPCVLMEDDVLLLGYVTVPVDGLVIVVNKVAYQFLFATPLLMIMVTSVVKFF